MENLLSLLRPGRAYGRAELQESLGEEISAEAPKVGLDALSSAELDALAKIRARFLPQSSLSDRLRLPRIASATDQEISEALARISSMTGAPVARSEAAAIREQQMRATIADIAGMISAAQRKPNNSV